MRNLIVAVAAVGGGWLMAHCAQQWAVAATSQLASGPNPTMGLFIGPAALFGALGGALLAGLLLPR